MLDNYVCKDDNLVDKDSTTDANFLKSDMCEDVRFLLSVSFWYLATAS